MIFHEFISVFVQPRFLHWSLWLFSYEAKCAYFLFRCFTHLIYLIYSVGFRNTNLSYHTVKRTIARKKNKQYSKIPRTFEQLKAAFSNSEVLNEYGLNLDGDAKFYLGTKITKEYEFAVFYSDFVVNFIEKEIPAERRFYLMDATFASLPKGIYQLLVITIAYKNNVSIH